MTIANRHEEWIRRGLIRHPDDGGGLEDDAAFWTGLSERLWREPDVDRDWHGRFADQPDAAVGRRSASPFRRRSVDKLAEGYAQAAQMIADGYAAKMEREYDEGRLRNWIVAGKQAKLEGTLDLGTVDVQATTWDTGEIMLLPYSRVTNERGKGIYASDPNAEQHIVDETRRLLDAAKATTTETQRKQARGGIVQPNTEEGKVVYPALRAAIAENRETPRFQDLRERFPSVENNVLAVSEKGYGQFPLGIADIFVSASNSQHTQITAINGPALKFSQTHTLPPGSLSTREAQFGPRMSSGTVRSTAALLRHEWGHALWRRLTDEQRQQFSDLMPGNENDPAGLVGGRWDLIREGLTQYASSDQETIDKYMRDYGEKGYLTETFAEMLAVTHDAEFFEPSDWPDWVNRAAAWIDDLEDES